MLSHQATGASATTGPVHIAVLGSALVQRRGAAQKGAGALRSAPPVSSASGHIPALASGTRPELASSLDPAGLGPQVGRGGRCGTRIPGLESRLTLQGCATDIETVT